MTRSMARHNVKRINLALQGGGAHGAFTWGVLDRLLQEPGIEIEGISGTSAGAMNGAAIKSGMIQGGREHARELLDWLWGEIGAIDNVEMLRFLKLWTPPTSTMSKLIEHSPGFMLADMFSRITSPYYSGNLVRNPLEPIAAKLYCDALCSHDGPDFSIGATNVRTGKIKIFRHSEITPAAIVASACLPTLFQAVEIEDPETGKLEAYWDGGYTGNPALFPLFDQNLPDDIVIININPLYREALPISPQQIQNRINEISFNTSLLRELRAIQFVKDLLADGRVNPGNMKRVLIHMIADDKLMNELSVATKMVPTPLVIDDMKKAGIRAAELFLRSDIDNIGKRDSIDLREMFG